MDERKAQRRAKALARKAEFDKLSLEQKLASLPKDGAARQRARYLVQIEKRKAATAEVAKRKEKKAEKVTVQNNVTK